MESLSLAALWLSLGCSALATIAAWSTVARQPLPLWRAAVATGTSGGWNGPHLAPQLRTGGFAMDPRLPRLLSRAVLGALVVSLAARAIATGHAPLTDLWEFTVALAAAVSAFQLGFGRKHGGPWTLRFPRSCCSCSELRRRCLQT